MTMLTVKLEYQKSLGTLNGRSDGSIIQRSELFSTIGVLGLSPIPNSWIPLEVSLKPRYYL